MHLSQRMLLSCLFLTLNCEICSSFDFGLWLLDLLKKTVFPHVPGLSEDDLKEAALTTTDLIKRDGYPVERHTMQTDDGYLLTVHRIPYGKQDTKQENRIPVLVVPRNGCASSMFVSGKNSNIGYKLAENRYDVWLGNLRGNKYSRKHVSLSPEETEFWKYSMDAHANSDVPAMIDYILNETQSEHIQLISHSTGSLLVLMCLARNTAYNLKVRGSVHLAPTVHFRYSPTLYRPIMESKDIFQTIFYKLGIYENVPPKLETLLGYCPSEDPSICESVVYSFTGYQTSFDRKKLPIYMSQCPTGFSNQAIFHFGQFFFRNDVLAYDYRNETLNMKKYGQSKPPRYDLKRITSPQAIFYSNNDAIGNPIDTALLIKELNSSVFNYLVPDVMYTHLDFMYADNAEEMVHIPLLETLTKMWKNQY